MIRYFIFIFSNIHLLFYYSMDLNVYFKEEFFIYTLISNNIDIEDEKIFITFLIFVH
jgi:hypothetical protein